MGTLPDELRLVTAQGVQRVALAPVDEAVRKPLVAFEGSLARRFVVRCRPEDMEDLNEAVRIAVIRKLMEIEQRTEDLSEEDIAEMEVLLGVTPS